MRTVTKYKTLTASTENPTEFRSTAVLPYVKGLSEHLNFAAVYNNKAYALFSRMPSSQLKQDGVVYKILRECGKVYMGGTG